MDSNHMQSQAQQQQPPAQTSAQAQKTVSATDQVELDHAIGFSGKIVNSVFLHPNTKEYILVAGCSIVVGDLNDPHNQHFLTAHDDQITCLTLSNQGHLLASGQRGDNSDIVIWDYQQKKAMFRLSEHDYEVTHVDFSHDDKLLLSTGNQLDGKLFIWDTSNGYIVSSIQLIPTVFSQAPTSLKWGGFVKDIKLRPTTKYQFAISGSKKLTLWQLDPANGQCTHQLVNTGTFIRDYSCMAFSKPNEEFLFAGTLSGDFCSFQIKNKLLVFTQNVCAQGIKTIQAVTNDKICIGGGDGQIALFHVDQNFCQALLKTQLFGSINGLSSSLDGIQILTATDKGFIYRMRTSDFSKMLLCENHTEPVLDAYYMPGVSDKFSTCSEDGTIRIWDANDYSVSARISVMQTGDVYPICSIFTDEVIISGWSDGKIRSFKIDGCTPLWQIDNAHKNGVTAISLAYNQKFICSGGMNGEVRVWEIRSRELVSHLKEHSQRVTKVQVFPDDIHVLSCARDRSILCWDLKNEKRVANQTQSMGGINCFSVASLDNNKYITVGQERKITYWDLRKAQPENLLPSSPFKEESDELLSVCISNNCKYFVTGGTLGIVRIYDFVSGQFITECRAHSSSITSVKFASDDKQIISTGRDGLIVVWNFFL